MNCASGGTAVLAGVDANGDGVLADDEVQDTSYVCEAGGGLCPGGVAEGSFRVENAIEVALFAECTTVTGDLRVLATRGSFPRLTTIGGSFNGSVGLEALDMPVLASVGGSFLFMGITGPADLNLPGLASVGGDFYVTSSSTLTSLEVPALVSVGLSFGVANNTALTTVVAPNLASVGGSNFAMHSNPALPTCSVQALLDRLIAAGFAGTAEITGNDDTATCP